MKNLLMTGAVLFAACCIGCSTTTKTDGCCGACATGEVCTDGCCKSKDDCCGKCKPEAAKVCPDCKDGKVCAHCAAHHE